MNPVASINNKYEVVTRAMLKINWLRHLWNLGSSLLLVLWEEMVKVEAMWIPAWAGGAILCPRTETLQSGVGVSRVQEPRKRREAHCQKENGQDNIKNSSQKGQRKGKGRLGWEERLIIWAGYKSPGLCLVSTKWSGDTLKPNCKRVVEEAGGENYFSKSHY